MTDTKLPEGWDKAEEVKSSWFKFEKVGDNIKGTLISKRLQPSTDPTFPDQQIYELRDEEGEMWNVGISVKKSGTVQRLNNCKIGEIIGILFEKEIPNDKKGFHPSKALKVVTFGMDPDYEAFDVSAPKDDDVPFA